MKVFNINLNYIVGFETYNIGLTYVRVIDLTFLYFRYKSLYFSD